MSGPMASLSKSRRVPFRAPEESAARRAAAGYVSGPSSVTSTPRPSMPQFAASDLLVGSGSDADDPELAKLANEVLDDQVARKLRLQHPQPPLQRPLPPLSKRRPGSGSSQAANHGGGFGRPPLAPPTDAELLASAASRAAALERECRDQREELARRQRRIDILEDKVRLLSSAAAAAAGNSKELDALRSRCRELQKQTHQMENFLADYGLIWVGEEDGDDDDGDGNGENWNWDGGVWKPQESTATSAASASSVDFNRIFESLAELNRLAGLEELKVTPTQTGATLARQSDSAIPLCIYANGLALWEGPFRPYDDPATRQFLADIAEGYFPSELQSRFPDGVTFAVADRREVEFRGGFGAAAGAGQKLGGGSGGGGFPDKKATERFLNRLPPAVVSSSGRLVDIRQSVADSIQQQRQSSPPQQTSGVILIDAAPPTEPPDTVASIKVRAAGIRKTYLIRVPFGESVAALFRLIRAREAGGGSTTAIGGDFSLLNAYPRERLDEADSRSLMECGLTPNATLLLVTQKQQQQQQPQRELSGLGKSANKEM